MIISSDFACKDSIKFRFKEENGHKIAIIRYFLLLLQLLIYKMKMNQRLYYLDNLKGLWVSSAEQNDSCCQASAIKPFLSCDLFPIVVSLCGLPSNGGNSSPSVHGNGHYDWVPTDGIAHEPRRARHTIQATTADKLRNRWTCP